MRTTLIAILATASLVSAQNFAGEPSCAIPCLTSAISIAGCQLADEACQCGTGISAIQSAVATCLLSACNQTELAVAASVGFGLCSAFSSSLASASATTTSALSSKTVTTTSSIPVSTTKVTAVTTSVAATTSAPSSKTSQTTSSSSSSSSSAPAPVSSNAAPIVMAGVGGLLGLGAAFVAAL